jgi:hypothetical protein
MVDEDNEQWDGYPVAEFLRLEALGEFSVLERCIREKLQRL